jgi:hypothetical protein
LTPEQLEREKQLAAEYLQKIRNGEPLEIIPTFYSELGRTIEEINLQTASGTQWLKTLNNLQGFNQEEMQWVGLPKWLAQQRGQITKWQIGDFLREHEVCIKDVVKAEDPSGFIRVSETSWRNNIGVTLVREREGAMDGDPEWALYDSQGHYLQGHFMMHHDAVDWYKKTDGSSQLFHAYYPDHQLHGGINYREVLLTLPPQASVRAKFRSDHFKENNVIAHIRFNERTDIDGKKVLFIEEIGSEWASRLRNRGSNKGQEVPDMPFKSSWPELAMKRMLRWGAEHHFDRIAWAMGKQMAHRYKALHRFDTVKWIRWKNSQGFEIYGYHRGRSWYEVKNVAPDQLPRMVGNNLAEKILTAAKTNIWGEFSGLGIWSGNKGLSTFYDKTLPNTANRYVAQWGIQVETGEIAVPNLTPWIPPGSVDERLVIEKYGEDVEYSKVSVLTGCEF